MATGWNERVMEAVEGRDMLSVAVAQNKNLADQQLVAAPAAGYRIAVYGWCIQSDDVTDDQVGLGTLQSNATAKAYVVAALEGQGAAPFAPLPIFICAAAEALKFTTNANMQAKGVVSYKIIPA